MWVQWKSSDTGIGTLYQGLVIAIVSYFWKLPSLLFPKSKAREKSVLIHTPEVCISSSKLGELGVLKGWVEQEFSVWKTKNLKSIRNLAEGWLNGAFKGQALGFKRSLAPTPNPKTLWPGTIHPNSLIFQTAKWSLIQGHTAQPLSEERTPDKLRAHVDLQHKHMDITGHRKAQLSMQETVTASCAQARIAAIHTSCTCIKAGEAKSARVFFCVGKAA